ncbi:MAG: helix-turn-helix domain-containing protein, partial [Halobacteriales archaeon]|nr:helix-turn-helix domain-containing protein [Halobacteriales archaeon]
DGDREPELVDLSDEDAGTVFEVLSSRMARRVIARLYESPATASEVADAVDTSLQNASYHLTRLSDADIVTEVGTWYSSRGVEMTVYAPTSEPLLLVAGVNHLDEFERDLVTES